MIFYWLRKLAAKIAWLFMPVQPRDVARVRVDAACPVCGNRENVLRCVHLAAARGNNNGQQIPLVMCQHSCVDCGARWYEKPVVKVGVNEVFSAIPRDDIERAEDKTWERGLSNVLQ